MPLVVRIVLLLLALIAFAAGGAALAIVRSRGLREQGRDPGMMAVALSLIVVGALCTAAATSLGGILALGGVSVWASYILTAQRLGVFRVQTGQQEPEVLEEPRRHA